MLRRLVEISLRQRAAIITLSLILIGWGFYVTSRAKLDVFPDFVQPQVTIQTESPGLAPEQVETLVTLPVETVLSGAGNMESIRSESIQGLSVVTAVFKEGTEIYQARQMIAERLAQLGSDLPAGVKSPKMEPLTSSTMDLLKFGLTSEKLSPMDLRTFVDWTVRPRLLSVPGVAAVKTFGGEVQQLQIQFRPARLLAFDVSVQDVIAAAKESTGVVGAGIVDTPGQRLVLETQGQLLTAEELGQVVVAQRDGRVIRLKDVATVVAAAETKFGDALINGRPGMLVTTASQYGANTLEATLAVEKALAEMQPLFDAEGIEYVPHMHRPATFVEIAVRNMKSSLLLGAVLVAIILYLFLLDLRTVVISFLSIPLSLLTAIIVLDHFGVTLNTMTLGGLAVALGVVVDDAIIDVENILRRLRENLRQPEPRPLFSVILEASLEVRSAVVYATFIVALVFLPVLTMTGLQGKFFSPLGQAFILATMASLAAALTMTPALCYFLLNRVKLHEEARYLSGLKRLHRRILARICQYPKTVIGAACVLLAGAGALLPLFGSQFLPDFREGHFVISVTMAPGTSLEEMKRLGARISADLLAIPEIASVEEQIGRAVGGEDTWGPHRGEMHVELKPDPKINQENVQNEIRDALSKYPSVETEVQTFLGDRISETIAGETAQVVISVFGADLDELDQAAAATAQVLKSVPGAADIQVGAPPGAPRMVIRLRQERLTQFGFRPVEVLEAVRLNYEGEIVAQIYDGNKVSNVMGILAPEIRNRPGDIGDLLISNSSGNRMKLKQLADIYLTTGRYAILHEGARRYQTITCNPRGRDVASFVADAQNKIQASVKFPTGTYVEYSGAAEQQQQAQRELILHSLVSGVGILLLLSMVFRKLNQLLLVLTNLPFALVGGVLAIFLTGYFGNAGQVSLSLGTLVGFVTLFGITMRNSIMMISHFEHLVRVEGMDWGLEAALRGASERLVPILMTALVTGLGLLPLAIGSGGAGREIEGPMAIVILGGLVTSTALNLLILPTLALRYGHFGERKA